MTVDVVLVRAKSPVPGATETLAQAIGNHYGVPAQTILAKLAQGSFSVKSQTDIATARRYRSDLEALGAVCELRDSQTGALLAAEPDVEELTLQPEPAPLRTPLPTSQTARPPTPALGKHEQDPSLAGLAAADGNFSADLGAIGAGNLSLSTLDGRTGDTEPPPIAGMPSAPPPTPQVASSHNVVSLDSRDLASAPLPHPGSSDANRFAPPTVEGHEEELTLAFDPAIDGPPGGQSAPVAAVVESAPHATQTMAPEPPPQRTMAPEPPPQRTMAPEPPPQRTMAPEPGQQAEHSQRQTLSPEVSTDSSPPKPSIGARFSEFVVSMRGGLAARGRGAFVTGVAIAMLCGFLIAHVVGVIQETNAFPPARKELLASYAEATDESSHAGLESIRASTIDLISSRKRRIATTSMLLWLVVSAGIGFVWFRVIRWEQLDALPPTATSSPQ